MTDEEKASIRDLLKTADIYLSERQTNILCRAFELSITKGYEQGLAEGEKIGKEKQWKATEKAQKKTSAKIKELEKELELAISDDVKLLLASKGWFSIDKGYDEALTKAKTEYQEELKKRVENKE